MAMDDHDDLDVKHPHLRLINTPEEIRVKNVSDLPVLGRKKGLSGWVHWRGIEKGSLAVGLFCIFIIIFAAAVLLTSAIVSSF